VPFPITLSAFKVKCIQGHSSIASLFKCDSSNIAQQLTKFQLT